LPGLDALVAEADQYTASVAIPPFFADTLPSMPVVSYYEKGMEPGAVPMQFVRFYVDYYIPEIYTRVSFEDQRDLVDLYTTAATFFNLSITTAPSASPTDPPATLFPTAAPNMIPSNASSTTAPDNSTPTLSPETASPADVRGLPSSSFFVAGSIRATNVICASIAVLLIGEW